MRRRLSVGSRFLLASIVEAGWEILENTPLVIDRYRAATASLNYYGDSILNSTFDLLAAMLGFWIAWKLNWKWALALVVAIELLLAYSVRDNLTLNILMLFYPVESIKQWQLVHNRKPLRNITWAGWCALIKRMTKRLNPLSQSPQSTSVLPSPWKS